jgi:hypothetical protein
MKIHPALRRLFLSLALVAAGLFGWQPAAQASIDDFISVYKKIEAAAPPGSLPASSADIIAYKSLFECVEGGGDSVECINEFHQTNAGKNASDQADIPEGVWQVVEAYVAWKQGDTWGVVEHLGAAAACAVLQVLAAGTDICGLIQDLYDAAKDVYDAVKWAAKFFESLGEGAWDAVKSVGCTLGLGGCDDSPPPPPPEVSAYNQFFAPKIKDGSALTARESANPNAFGTLLLQTSSAAQKKYSFDAVKKAADVFEKAAYQLWSDNMGKVILDLGGKRSAYGGAEKNQHVAAAVGDAVSAYLSNKAAPKDRAYSHCRNDFSNYLHFDYWYADSRSHALWQQLGSPSTSTEWCTKFWYQNTATFGKYFHDAVAAFCPASGSKLFCGTLAKYENCLGIMGSVGQSAQCAASTTAIGKDVAKEIIAYFQSKGSKYSCEIVAMLSTPGSQIPATLRCHRPTQQYHCNKYYQDHYGSGPTKLPMKVLNCELGTLSPGGYGAKENNFWTHAIPELEQTHPDLKFYAQQKGPDPMVVGVSGGLFAALEVDAKKYGVQTKTVLSLDPTIDGEENPVFANNIGSTLNAKNKNTVPAFGGVNPPDPTGMLTLNKLAGNPAKPSARGIGGALKHGGVQGTKAGGNVSLDTKLVPGAGAMPGGVGAPTKTLSGEMPPGFGGPASARGPSSMRAKAKPVLPGPNLAVVSASTIVQNNCANPKPALVANVMLRNSGGALSAGKGNVYVSEDNGSPNRLSSNGIPLPAFAAGQVRTVSIPAISLGPYTALAGSHTLTVHLLPQLAGGRYSFPKPATDRQIVVTFPANFCKATVRAVPATRLPGVRSR